MKLTGLFALSLFVSVACFAQQVGIGTTNPSERLDVNGNINVTGTIKANGVDGQPNQVLMKNGTGNLAWADLCNYKDVAMFSGFGNITWNIPAGITRIFVEAWGAGGGGSTYSGGGGGGYTAATFTVNPGDPINMILGEGGTSGNQNTAGGMGGSTSVNIGPYAISASGGFGAPANFQMGPVMGGGGNASNGFTNYIIIRGGSGEPSLNTFVTNGSNTYEIMSGGDGGSAGNAEGTGGMGGYRMLLVGGLPTTVRARSAEGGKAPGGGGGSGTSMVSNTVFTNGNAGSFGMVIIHY
jgi:hypothetical protein